MSQESDGVKEIPLTLTQVDTGVRFYHQSDERTFFEWLGRIPCVDKYTSEGSNGLVVHLKRVPKDEELRELIALFRRFGVEMHQLAKFKNNENSIWFCDPNKYWYQGVFGSPSL